MVAIKGTSVFLICLLVLTVIYGVSATLIWYLEEAKEIEDYSKTLLDDKLPHRLKATFVDDKLPHSSNITFIGTMHSIKLKYRDDRVIYEINGK